jgi:hypothetical protein
MGQPKDRVVAGLIQSVGEDQSATAVRLLAADGPGPGTVELGKFAERRLAQVEGRWIEERMTVWDKVEVGRRAEKPHGARSLVASGLAGRSLAGGSLR